MIINQAIYVVSTDLEALDQALRDGEWSGRAGAEQVARTRALPAVG